MANLSIKICLWLDAAPSYFFIKKEIYEKYGLFRTEFKIVADFDIMTRFLFTHKISYYYIKEVFG
jgi:hypothetical protein